MYKFLKFVDSNVMSCIAHEAINERCNASMEMLENYARRYLL